MTIMHNPLEYKGFIGSVEWDPIEATFFGVVQNCDALIEYSGADIAKLKQEFIEAVDLIWETGL